MMDVSVDPRWFLWKHYIAKHPTHRAVTQENSFLWEDKFTVSGHVCQSHADADSMADVGICSDVSAGSLWFINLPSDVMSVHNRQVCFSMSVCVCVCVRVLSAWGLSLLWNLPALHYWHNTPLTFLPFVLCFTLIIVWQCLSVRILPDTSLNLPIWSEPGWYWLIHCDTLCCNV